MTACFYLYSRARLLALALTLLAACALGLARAATAQDAQLDAFAATLRAQGLPVVAVSAASRLPLTAAVTLQSTSAGPLVAPADPLHIHAVQRAAALQSATASLASELSITVLSTAGTPLFWAQTPIHALALKPTANPSTPLDSALSAAVAPLTITTLTTTPEPDGAPGIHLHLLAPDLPAANAALPTLMPTLTALAPEAIWHIEVRTAPNDALLLTYLYDPALGQAHWWQAEALTRDWFPSPPP